MTGKKWFVVSLLVCAIAAVAWQRNAVVGLRHENEAVAAQRQEAAQLAQENQDLAKLRSLPAVHGPGDPGLELLKLRNQVRQLRAQERELERLHLENQRLVAELKSGNFAPHKLSEMEGYVAKEQWANAGFGMPEATAQTL